MIHRLLLIKHNSSRLMFLLIPAVYGLWLYAVAKAVAEDETERDYLSALTLVLTACFFIISIDILRFIVQGYPAIHWHFYAFTILLLNAVSLLLPRCMIKYERKLFQNENDPISFSELFVRYFLLSGWWSGIWSMQMLVNLYEERK